MVNRNSSNAAAASTKTLAFLLWNTSETPLKRSSSLVQTTKTSERKLTRHSGFRSDLDARWHHPRKQQSTSSKGHLRLPSNNVLTMQQDNRRHEGEGTQVAQLTWAGIKCESGHRSRWTDSLRRRGDMYHRLCCWITCIHDEKVTSYFAQAQ